MIYIDRHVDNMDHMGSISYTFIAVSGARKYHLFLDLSRIIQNYFCKI